MTPPGLALLLDRRSIANLTEPGPTPEQLELILAAATTVPDHGQLRPWRFVVVTGTGRAAFGDALAATAAPHLPPGSADKLSKIRGKAFIAPMLVVLVASPRDSPKVPEWEQASSASCTGFAMALAAHALGLGAVWKSAAFLRGEGLDALLDLLPAERLLGWVNLGTPRDGGPPPGRPPVSQVARVLDGPVLRPYREPAPEGSAAGAPADPVGPPDPRR